MTQSEGNVSKSGKRKRENDDDIAIKAALKVLTKEPDEYDRFGEYVALELRTLQSDFVRKKLKNEIRKAIVRAADEDEAYTMPCTSESNTRSNSPGYTISVQSPSALPEASHSAKDFIEHFNFSQL
mgnify:CR=1 FL=1